MSTGLTLVGITLVVIFGGGTWWTAARRKSWQRAAQALGVRFSEESFWWQWSLEGRVRGCDVRVVNVRSKLNRHFFTSMLIQPRPPLPVDLKIRAEDLKTKALKLLGTDDLLSGDADFDREVWLAGAPMEVLARLDARARQTTRRVLRTRAAKARVEGGAAHFEHRSIIGNGKTIRTLVLDLVGWMERLQSAAIGESDALLAMLQSDPVPGVRARCLDVLLAQPPAIADQAAVIGMRDADATVRLHAALAAGPAGCPLLIDALSTADVTQAGAIFKALEAHAPADARTQARRWVTVGMAPASAAAIETAGRLGMRDLIEHFEALAPDPTCAAAIVDAARLLGDRRVEPALLAALAHLDNPTLSRAIDTLGHLGTRAAIAPLRAIRGRPRKAAQAAIERIAEREAPGAGGGLSLTADSAGALSTVGDEAGSLALAHDEDPR